MKKCSIVYVGLKTGVKWLDGDFNKSQDLSQSPALAKLQKKFESEKGCNKPYTGKHGKAAYELLKKNGYNVAFNDYDHQLQEAMTQKEVDEFIDKLRKNVEVKFKYKKAKDGSIRKARGTLDPKTIKKGLSSSAIEKARRNRAIPMSIIIYWDLDQEMFRSFRKSNFIGYID